MAFYIPMEADGDPMGRVLAEQCEAVAIEPNLAPDAALPELLLSSGALAGPYRKPHPFQLSLFARVWGELKAIFNPRNSL
jgi:hypothetical protein